MKEEKNTDHIFREKLEGFSAPPPPHIWDNVQAQLAARKQNNRIAVIGWISAAAVVVLAFLAGWYFNGNLKNEEISSVSTEIIQPEKGNSEKSVISTEKQAQDQPTIETEFVLHESAKTNRVSQNRSMEVATLTKSSEINMVKRENFRFVKLESVDAQVKIERLPKNELAQNYKILPENYLSENEQSLVAQNIKNLKEITKPDKNWKMGMYVAPGYSSHVAVHSESYSKNMTYSGSDGNTNVSGGFSVQYKTRKRWIVESGVYYAQNGQQSNNSVNLFSKNLDAEASFAPGDITYFSNAVKVENNNIAMNSTAGVIEFSETPKGAELSGDFEASKATTVNLLVPNGEFSQVFEFMEIPLFVRYRVIDSKIGIELISGLNAGFVVGNNAYIENQYGLQNIGETQDISTVNLSGTLGVGVNYALGKHFAVALEPRFNYYLNSINTNPSVEFRPYRIGFYTGVSYAF